MVPQTLLGQRAFAATTILYEWKTLGPHSRNFLGKILGSFEKCGRGE